MNYERWCSLSDDELRQYDVAELNLRAAEGLPGSEQLDIPACLYTLDKWAELVRKRTERNWYRFVAAPAEFDHSPGQFHMLALVTVVQRDLKATYRTELIGGEYDATDSRPWFIHGLLTGHGGTCVSMPVLYLAIGRRLGYPLHLVEAQEHLLVRWEQPGGERFNVEGTGQGCSFHDDEHYLRWPKPMTSRDRRYMLRNLTPREELAAFLNQRGHCWADHLQTGRALLAYDSAVKLAPDNARYQDSLAIARMMHLILGDIWKIPDIDMPILKAVEQVIPTLAEKWGARAAKFAKEHFQRILANRRQKSLNRARERVFEKIGTDNP